MNEMPVKGVFVRYGSFGFSKQALFKTARSD